MFIKCSIVILDSPHYYTFYIFNLGVVINLDHCKLTSAVSPLTTVHSLICTIQNHIHAYYEIRDYAISFTTISQCHSSHRRGM